MQTEATEQFPYPKSLEDIRCEVLYEKKNRTVYCIGNVERNCYIFANDNQKDAILIALDLFDGNRSLDEIETTMLEKYNIKTNLKHLQDTCIENGLIVGNVIDSVTDNAPKKKRRRRNEIELLLVNVLEIELARFHGPFTFLSRHVRPVAIGMTLLSVFSLLAVFGQANEMLGFDWSGILSNPTAILFYLTVQICGQKVQTPTHPAF